MDDCLGSGVAGAPLAAGPLAGGLGGRPGPLAGEQNPMLSSTAAAAVIAHGMMTTPVPFSQPSDRPVFAPSPAPPLPPPRRSAAVGLAAVRLGSVQLALAVNVCGVTSVARCGGARSSGGHLSLSCLRPTSIAINSIKKVLLGNFLHRPSFPPPNFPKTPRDHPGHQVVFSHRDPPCETPVHYLKVARWGSHHPPSGNFTATVPYIYCAQRCPQGGLGW